MQKTKALQSITRIDILLNAPSVVQQVAFELGPLSTGAQVVEVDAPCGDHFYIGLADHGEPFLRWLGLKKLPDHPFIYLKINEDGRGCLLVSHLRYLYSFAEHLQNDLAHADLSQFNGGKLIRPAFSWHRTAYDYFLTQEGRITAGLDRESYVRELARNGFTHLEVNGLASPMGLETGPKGETYPMFYTYCPALDQFVYSALNKGLYPSYYLSANLNYLKENAKLAREYGLTPGLLCFEPRSVPERFFDKYPMLRGARVDHPFRSFMPRYNMTITHPKVLSHYAGMVEKLLTEVPDLGFLNIWTNDSGAGFEHTKSLYVGRNGGAYLIREWKNDAEISELAGENALRFFRTLRDAAGKTNPDFRIITRMESFYGEHEVIMRGLTHRVDIETASMVQRGWDMPYHHPKYPDKFDLNAGSLYQQDFDAREREGISRLAGQGSRASFYFSYGPQTMFAPLLGIPYPKLTLRRLKTLRDNGVEWLSHMGGSCPPEKVPWNVNHSVLRHFQYQPDVPADQIIAGYARHHAGSVHSPDLLKVWDLTEEAILGFPNVTALYSTIGFAWYRLWVRPLVPDIEALPQEERNYYEEHMCTTPHNPNNVDLSRDVLFQLINPKTCYNDVERIDQYVWKPLDEAITILQTILDRHPEEMDETPILYDQLVRIRALRCWIMTQRNVAAWVDAEYGYQSAMNKPDQEQYKGRLKNAIRKEIENSYELLDLLESPVEFMALTDRGETALMYGDNIKELVVRRINLMKGHIDDDPHIDMDYMMRKAGEPVI